MNQITIYGFDDKMLRRLKELAWQNGEGFEDCLRRLLTEAADRQRPAVPRRRAPACGEAALFHQS